MGDGLEFSGLARKTRVERGWIDLGFQQTTRVGRREIFFCLRFKTLVCILSW